MYFTGNQHAGYYPGSGTGYPSQPYPQASSPYPPQGGAAYPPPGGAAYPPTASAPYPAQPPAADPNSIGFGKILIFHLNNQNYDHKVDLKIGYLFAFCVFTSIILYLITDLIYNLTVICTGRMR